MVVSLWIEKEIKGDNKLLDNDLREEESINGDESSEEGSLNPYRYYYDPESIRHEQCCKRSLVLLFLTACSYNSLSVISEIVAKQVITVDRRLLLRLLSKDELISGSVFDTLLQYYTGKVTQYLFNGLLKAGISLNSVKKLIKLGAKINDIDDELDFYPLRNAAKSCSPSVVRYLLELGSHIDFAFHGESSSVIIPIIVELGMPLEFGGLSKNQIYPDGDFDFYQLDELGVDVDSNAFSTHQDFGYDYHMSILDAFLNIGGDIEPLGKNWFYSQCRVRRYENCGDTMILETYVHMGYTLEPERGFVSFLLSAACVYACSLSKQHAH